MTAGSFKNVGVGLVLLGLSLVVLAHFSLLAEDITVLYKQIFRYLTVTGIVIVFLSVLPFTKSYRMRHQPPPYRTVCKGSIILCPYCKTEHSRYVSETKPPERLLIHCKACGKQMFIDGWASYRIRGQNDLKGGVVNSAEVAQDVKSGNVRFSITEKDLL